MVKAICFSFPVWSCPLRMAALYPPFCIDNGPMEGFWGILKRETYYGRRFTSRSDLVNTIETYIRYYNTERIQRKLQLMTPVEYHESYYAAA